MAIVNGMKRFEFMLRHSTVTVITDSENCVDLLTQKDWNRVPALWLRWRRYLTQTFRLDLLHVPGKLNVAADVLSRQTITINSIWKDDETFFSPVLRNIYNEQRSDPEVMKLIEGLKGKKFRDSGNQGRVVRSGRITGSMSLITYECFIMSFFLSMQ